MGRTPPRPPLRKVKRPQAVRCGHCETAHPLDTHTCDRCGASKMRLIRLEDSLVEEIIMPTISENDWVISRK